MRNLGIVGMIGLWMTLGTDGTAQDAPSLYTCADMTTASEAPLGVTLCNAKPTSMLTGRAEADNLQIRDGALVLDINTAGVAATAGLLAGDMIYRIGGIDVSNTSAAIKELSRVGNAADTVVNFLRSGRPYRIKLRRS